MEGRCLSVDRISTLPPGIIEDILCLLPIQEAARTSILSREWRYKWTTISKIEFNADTFQHRPFGDEHALILDLDVDETFTRKQLTERCRFFAAMYQVLFVHQGPIHEFTLSIFADETYLEIDQVLDHLSRNNPVEKLKFTCNLCLKENYRLLLSAFPFHHLTDLHVEECAVYLQPSFYGFGSLTSLYLKTVTISQETLLHLVSKSPLLKSFSMLLLGNSIDDSTMTRLFECLPVIEHLAISGCRISFPSFARRVASREHPTSLVHLKYFSIEFMVYFPLPLLAFMMRSSPNLGKLKLQKEPWLTENGDSSLYGDFSTEPEDTSDIWLEHMKEFEFKYFTNDKYELEFVRLILAKSPILKKVRIVLHRKVSKDEMIRILLSYPRASPVAVITVVGEEVDDNLT